MLFVQVDVIFTKHNACCVVHVLPLLIECITTPGSDKFWNANDITMVFKRNII
jgi:hypothetical protein